MSTSFIDFKERGYWISDGFVEVVSWLLYLEFEKLVGPSNWQLEMKENFYRISQEHFPGWNSFLLDDYLVDDSHLSVFSEIIDSTISSVEKKGAVIITEELNAINKENVSGGGRWTEDLEVSRIINLLLDIKKMIQNKGGYDLKDPVNYSW